MGRSRSGGRMVQSTKNCDFYTWQIWTAIMMLNRLLKSITLSVTAPAFYLCFWKRSSRLLQHHSNIAQPPHSAFGSRNQYRHYRGGNNQELRTDRGFPVLISLATASLHLSFVPTRTRGAWIEKRVRCSTSPRPIPRTPSSVGHGKSVFLPQRGSRFDIISPLSLHVHVLAPSLSSGKRQGGGRV